MKQLWILFLILVLAGCSAPGPAETTSPLPTPVVLTHLFEWASCHHVTITSDVPMTWAQGKLPNNYKVAKGNTPQTSLLNGLVMVCPDATVSMIGITIQSNESSPTRTFVYLIEATTAGNADISALTGDLLNRSTDGTITATLSNPTLSIQVEGDDHAWAGTGVSVPPYTALGVNRTTTFVTDAGRVSINGVGTLTDYASTFTTTVTKGPQLGAYPNDRIPGLAQTFEGSIRLLYNVVTNVP